MLTIGYHQLEGKRIELKKPYAVLDRVPEEDGQGAVEYKVLAGLPVRRFARLPACLPGHQAAAQSAGASHLSAATVIAL